MNAWHASKDLTPQALGKILAVEYRKSYQGGSHGTEEVTMSAFDLSFMPTVETAIRTMSTELRKLSNTQLDSVRKVIKGSQYFYFADYVDMGDFSKGLRSAGIGIQSHLDVVDSAMKKFIIANEVTTGFKAATGASLWIPTDGNSFTTDQNR